MKHRLSLILALTLIFLSGCAKKDLPKPSDYVTYDNKELGITIDLPPTFKHFQTQKKDREEAKDIEIFVPTTDAGYSPQEVPGYAKPIIIRTYTSAAYKKNWTTDKNTFEKIGKKDDRYYAISFWSKLPTDWASKWSKNSALDIKQRFKIKD